MEGPRSGPIGPDQVEKRGDAGADGDGLHEKHGHECQGFAARMALACSSDEVPKRRE